MEMLKTLWYVRKARIYEKLVTGMMAARNKAKIKQLIYKTKAEEYRAKVKGRVVRQITMKSLNLNTLFVGWFSYADR